MSFLFSAKWWSESFKLVLVNAGAFLLPALLFGISNICSVFADAQMSTGLDLSAFDGNGNNAMLDNLVRVLVVVLIESIVGLVLGLIALSSWLVNLSALVKMQLAVIPTNLQDARVQIKNNSKHFGLVWLLGFVYLLAPILPMSALIAVSTLVRMNLRAFNEPLLVVPSEFLLPINLAAGILFLVVVNYCFILTVLSTTDCKAKAANDLTVKILFTKLKELFLLDIFVVFLDGILSCAPLALESLSGFAGLAKNLPYNVCAQVWLALSSIIVWPLSLLMFVSFLKPEIESQIPANLSSENS